MSDRCLEYCEKMLTDVYMAKTCLGLYEQTLGYDPKPFEMKDQFFRFSNHCYLYTLMMLLSKTYDNQKDAISLSKFLDAFEQTKPRNEVKSQINKDKTRLIVLSSEINHLNKLRDKFYAHSDKMDRDLLREAAPLTFKMMENLISNAEKILAYYYQILKPNHPVLSLHYQDYVTKDFENINGKLEKYPELYQYYLSKSLLVFTPQEVDGSDHE